MSAAGMTPQALSALKEQREQLWSTIDAILEENSSLSAELATVHEEEEQARRELEEERDRVNVQREDIRELRRQITELNKLIVNVPDLIQSAFQEGFGVDGGAYGDAWNASRTRKVLDGEAIPRPPEWDADKHRIAVLEAKLAARSAPVAVEVPERAAWLTIEEMADQAEKGWATHYGMEPISRSAAMQIARRIAKASMEKGACSPPSRILKDGRVQVPVEDVAMIRRALDDCAWDPVLQPIVDWTDSLRDALRSKGGEA